ERGLGVARVEAQRGLERLLGVLEPALGVVDDAEHVVDVGEPGPRAGGLGEERLGALEFASVVVLAAERDELVDSIAHAASLARTAASWAAAGSGWACRARRCRVASARGTRSCWRARTAGRRRSTATSTAGLRSHRGPAWRSARRRPSGWTARCAPRRRARSW